MSNQIDDSIPVLTEIIPVEQVESAEQAAQAAHEHWRGVTEEDWQKLELTLRESILKQVLARVDFVLEHRVRDSLADVLQLAVEGLAIDIRTGMQNSLEDVITRAVTQEINKVKTTKLL